MRSPVALTSLARVFLQLGVTTFGSSMLPLMEETVVRRNEWLTPLQLAQGIALAQLVPGPIAVKVAAYVGQSLRGWKGALTAVVCFSLPALCLVILSSHLFFHSSHWLWSTKHSTFLTPVIIGLLLVTCWRLGQRCLVAPRQWGTTCLAFWGLKIGWSPIVVLWGLGLLNVAWCSARQLWKTSFLSSSSA